MPDTSPPTRTAPASQIQVTLAGEERIVRMPFALLHRIMALVGTGEQTERLIYEANLQESVLLEIFSQWDPKLKQFSYRPESLEELDLSIDDTLNVLNWVMEHLSDFFLRQAENNLRQTQNSQSRLANLQSTASGIVDSLSKTPVASPFAPTPQTFGT